MELQYSFGGGKMKIIRAKVVQNNKLNSSSVNDVYIENGLVLYDILLTSSNYPNTSILSLMLFGRQRRDYALYQREDVVIHASV